MRRSGLRPFGGVSFGDLRPAVLEEVGGDLDGNEAPGDTSARAHSSCARDAPRNRHDALQAAACLSAFDTVVGCRIVASDSSAFAIGLCRSMRTRPSGTSPGTGKRPKAEPAAKSSPSMLPRANARRRHNHAPVNRAPASISRSGRYRDLRTVRRAVEQWSAIRQQPYWIPIFICADVTASRSVSSFVLLRIASRPAATPSAWLGSSTGTACALSIATRTPS